MWVRAPLATPWRYRSMVDQHNHNVRVVGSSPTISTIEYNKEIKIQGLHIGYPYFIDYSHPLATGNSGRVMLHRHVASMKVGRWLTTEEHVHHIDENKLNNLPDNLEVLSITEHNKIHFTRLKPIECKNCGSIFTPKESAVSYCSIKCSNNSRVKDKALTKELLEELLPYHSWKSLGQLLGYSDNGIRSRAISLGCDISLRNKNKKPR